jgi:transposase
MAHRTVIGIDTSKASFSLYGAKSGKKLFKMTLTREKFLDFFANYPRASVFMEACGGSNYWARKITKLGHDVKLIAPQKVTPHRHANKNDSNDALAIVRAADVVEMQFVAIKEPLQQDIQSLHRIRDRHIKNQTALANEIRGLLMEYGIVFPQGIEHVRAGLPAVLQQKDNELAAIIRGALADLHSELLSMTEYIERIDRDIKQIFLKNESCQKIAQVEGVGVITATAIVGTCPGPEMFKNGRKFAASLGLTPGHIQTGGKDSKPIMLGITKKGNPYVRKLLVQGAMSVIAQLGKTKKLDMREGKVLPISDANKAHPTGKTRLAPYRARKKLYLRNEAKKKNEERMAWLGRLVEEKGVQKAAVALAHRNARVIWALLKTGENYDVNKQGRSQHVI